MIQAGPRIDAGPRIQAGGLTCSLVLIEAGGFYPKLCGITAQEQHLRLCVSATASDGRKPGAQVHFPIAVDYSLGLISSRREKTTALHRSPQNNAFGAIAVQF